MGGENVYVPLPHGNMAKDTQEYHRTCPSVLTAVKKAITSETSVRLYKTNMFTPIGQHFIVEMCARG